MFGDQKTPQNIHNNKQILQNIICFPLYDMFTTSVFLRNNSTVRMVGKKKTCSNFIDFLTSYFLVRSVRKWKWPWTLLASLKSPSLPPVRANPRRVSVFFSSSVFTVRKGVRIGISGRILRYDFKSRSQKTGKWICSPDVMVLK